MWWSRSCALLVAALTQVACRSQEPAAPPDSSIDAPIDAVDKSAPCVGMFGQDLADGFGRFDGTVVAVVPPGEQACPHPNASHLILEVSSGGNVYRMVVATVSTVGDPDMALAERDTSLVGPPWQEGWHLDAQLDFVLTLGLHRADFTPMPQAALVDAITSQLELGARVSVFATVEGQPDSAHLVHRNHSNADGAIVIHPDTAPHYLLLRFDNQLF